MHTLFNTFGQAEDFPQEGDIGTPAVQEKRVLFFF